MDKSLKLTESVAIDSSAANVWHALTDPETIRKFMWGTHATSDWQEGSPIIFEGEWQGKPYREKGVILEHAPERKLRYTYLSSGNEDKPENYAIITYSLSQDGPQTTLAVTQEGANNLEALEHSKEGWRSMLGTLKKILEE